MIHDQEFPIYYIIYMQAILCKLKFIVEKPKRDNTFPKSEEPLT